LTPSVTPTATATATPTPSPTPTAGPTPDGVLRQLHVPILMYHYISVPPADADIYRKDLSVTPERFEGHLQYLLSAGYHVVTLDDLLYALTQGRPLPEKPVILTFDDGYEDNYQNAFPLLQKYGVSGHFFIISDFVNAGRPGYMSWQQIEEMAAVGQHFGSHSRDHPDLSGKPVDYLVWQALGGLESIQEHLGYHPRWVSYPSGGYDQQVIAVYKSANYWGGLAADQGATHTLDDIFHLTRVRVRGTYTAEDLANLLELDW
jgi:peptidoglycan/xylan/chitin deacetylase (PgdA/CDA1 family)